MSQPSTKISATSDFALAAVLWVIVLLVNIESIRLTFFVELPNSAAGSWSIAPGIMPLALSIGLLLMLTAVLIHSVRRGALSGSAKMSALIVWCCQSVQKQRALQAGVLLLYVFVAIGRLPFAVATGLYLFTSMSLAKAARLYWIALLSIGIPVAIVWLFGDLMQLPLP